MSTFPITVIPVASDRSPGTIYTVTVMSPTQAECSCPAAQHYDGPCKHARRILAELAEVLPGIAAPDPPPDRPAGTRLSLQEASAKGTPTPEEWIAAEAALREAERARDLEVFDHGSTPETVAARLERARQTMQDLRWRETVAQRADERATAHLGPAPPPVPSAAWVEALGDLAIAEIAGDVGAEALARARMAELRGSGRDAAGPDSPPVEPPARRWRQIDEHTWVRADAA